MCPITMFTGLAATDQTTTIEGRICGIQNVRSMESMRVTQFLSATDKQKSLERIHRKAADLSANNETRPSNYRTTEPDSDP